MEKEEEVEKDDSSSNLESGLSSEEGEKLNHYPPVFKCWEKIQIRNHEGKMQTLT